MYMLNILSMCSITRQDLGPYKLKVTVIPAVYFVTIIIVDFIMYSVRGRSAFNVADFDRGHPIELKLSSWERLLLVVCAVSGAMLLFEMMRVAETQMLTCLWCEHMLVSMTWLPAVVQFVNLMALMAAWVYIFDTIQKEREALETPERDIYAEAEAGQRPGEVSSSRSAQLQGGLHARFVLGQAAQPCRFAVQHSPEMFGFWAQCQQRATLCRQQGSSRARQGARGLATQCSLQWRRTCLTPMAASQVELHSNCALLASWHDGAS